MSERLNIAIPESLRSRLQAVKDRLNVSAICQQALELAIQIEESKTMIESKKESMITRLKLQREQSQNEWIQEGKSFGLSICEDLDYDDFKFMEGLWTKSQTEEWEDEDRLREAIVLNPSWLWLVEKVQYTYESCPEHSLNDLYEGIVVGINECWESLGLS